MPRARSAVMAAATVLAAALAGVVLAAPPSTAAEGPNRFERAQVGLTYTVYQPKQTAGLPRTSFALDYCAPGRDELLTVAYGSQSAGRWINVLQSQRGCVDGPDSVGPAATFTVRGATATVLGDCAGEAPTCDSATRAGVRRGAYTTVTLPSGGPGLGSTYVEVYTEGLSLAEIRTFVRSLTPVQ